MRARHTAVAALTLALTACGGGGPAGMGYAVPSSGSVTYMTADTTVIDIDAMGQMMQMSQTADGQMTAAFASAGDGVEVTMTVDDYSGRMNQPMGAPVTANESGIDGPMVFTMDRMGNVTVGSKPNVSGNAELLFTPLSTMYTFFPGLPGGAVAAGDMWTDTVSYSGVEGPGEVDVLMIMSYSAVGDTMVDGRTLMKINVTGGSESEASTNMQGMDVFQSIQGEVDGFVLWDSQAGVMYERRYNLSGQGTIDVSMAPQPLSISARGTSRAKIMN